MRRAFCSPPVGAEGPSVDAGPPYRLLARGLARGQVLGAGASLVNRPAGSQWDQRTSRFPPLGAELARWLADSCGFPSGDDRLRAELARVASFYQFGQAGRADLCEDLRTIFITDYQIPIAGERPCCQIALFGSAPRKEHGAAFRAGAC